MLDKLSMLPPSPTHLLRVHSTQVNALAFSVDNTRLYSGDASGLVVITSTQSLRPLASWRAHSDGILGIQEWHEDSVITHGRDNKLHVWTRVWEPVFLAETAATPELPLPKLKLSMDVNALNYCRFSLLPRGEGGSNNPDALIALPNLVDSSLVDIWAIPSIQRLHAAIGKDGETKSPRDGRGTSKTGIIMSLHLFENFPVSTGHHSQLRVLLAYENGNVSLMARTGDTEKSIEGKGWDRLWAIRLHVESVMAMTVKRDNTAAFTVSADNLLCRYDLEDGVSDAARSSVYRTKHPGNGALALRNDGRIVAVGGWDGKVRLYSTKTFKALGTLSYHKEGCQAITFSYYTGNKNAGASADDDTNEHEARSKWLASGGKDTRLAIWQLMDFSRK